MKVKIIQSFHRYGEATADAAGKMHSGPVEDFAAGWVRDLPAADAKALIEKGLAEDADPVPPVAEHAAPEAHS